MTAAAVALTAAAAMLAAGCGGTDTAATRADPGATPAVQRASLTTLDGTPVTVPGAKPAALFFFSVSCGECIAGATSLAQAATALGYKADFLAVDLPVGDGFALGGPLTQTLLAADGEGGCC